ncbi:MAG: hypothetical protein KC444_01275 [Nitrosopumilus sp.]|nr:hypothetical protein [Nitrosopumilus sp.]
MESVFVPKTFISQELSFPSNTFAPTIGKIMPYMASHILVRIAIPQTTGVSEVRNCTLIPPDSSHIGNYGLNY